MNVPRWLNPKTNPALYTAAIGVLFAIWQALQVQAAAGPLTWSQVGRVAGGVIFAAVVYGPHRRATTPVADPRDGNGNPLGQQSPIIKFTGDVIPEAAAALRKPLQSYSVSPTPPGHAQEYKPAGALPKLPDGGGGGAP